MKKILYIVTQGEFGGAQRYIFDLVTNLKHHLDITVATGSDPAPDNLLSRCKECGIKTHQFKSLIREINPRQDFRAIIEILDYIKKERPDIVHLNSAKAGVLGSLASYLSSFWMKKPKVIYTVHGWTFLEPIPTMKRLFYLWAEKFSARFRDAVIILSEKEKAITLKKRLSHPAKINLIPHGIKYDKMSFFIKEKARNILGEYIYKNLTEEHFIIGAVANLYPTKGIEYFIGAAKQIIDDQQTRSDSRKIVFIVIGEGSEREKLENLIKKYNLESSFFLAGSIPESYKLLRALDIFVLTSVKEGMPYVILEAMFAGLPIISTHVGAIPEMIENNVSGTIIPPQDDGAIKNAILELSSNSSKLDALSQQVQKRAVNNYKIDKMLQKTLNLYNNL